MIEKRVLGVLEYDKILTACASFAVLDLTKYNLTSIADAIAIAMRAEAPIFVTANVLMNGSVSTDSAKDQEEAQEFKDFIQNIKPSDFEKLMKGKHEESDQ